MDYQQAERLFVENGLDYDKELHGKLEIYFDFLVEYNKKVNLTAITDKTEVWIKHFLDSIITLKYVEIPKNIKMIDVGTGAGFPSVPLKLYRDDINLTLLDSLNKRVSFLKELSERLSIKTECIHSRAEDAAKLEDLREKFDMSAARAVAAMPKLCEYCLPFVKKGGHFIALKGMQYHDEAEEAAKAIKVMGGSKTEIRPVKLPELDDKRAVITITKTMPTPKAYPRKAGTPTKNPIV